MSSTTSKNLGTISAIWAGPLPPSNHMMMWIDNSSNPYVRKFWDTVTQQWLAVTFVASSGGNNPNKRLSIRVGGTTSLTIEDEVYVMNQILGSDVPINLLSPAATTFGLTQQICNYSSDDVVVNSPLRINTADTTLRIRAYTSVKIVIAEYYVEGVDYGGLQNFEWLIISNSIL
jgi:hypothetical protein